MSKIDSLLEEARALSNAERRQLAEKLLLQANKEAEGEESAAGERGLAAWTESTRSEDWSPFYPSKLR
ncbi:MAG: hypothetical protein HY721_08740 [Planctomycetes bacterium]|nr:hypothetical protein [Planctomycetota bacterium]